MGDPFRVALKSIMKERSWKQRDLAEALGISGAQVTRILHGQRDPSWSRVRGYLDRLGLEIRICRKGEADPVKRRELLTKVTAAGTAALVPSFVPSPKVLGNPYHDAEWVSALAVRLEHQLDELGGIPIAATAVRHFERVAFALHGTDRQLQAAASELGRQAAHVMLDLERFDSARHYAGLSLAFSKRAQDTQGQGRSYGTLSYVSLGQGDADAAGEYARRGLRLNDLGDQPRATLSMRLARSMAGMADASQARAVLDRALEVEGLSLTQSTVVRHMAGWALVDMGDYRMADYVLDDVAQSAESWSPHETAFCRMKQAEAALRGLDPSLAGMRMSELARAFPLVRSVELTRAVVNLLTISKRWGDVPEMRDAREQLGGLVRSPPAG